MLRHALQLLTRTSYNLFDELHSCLDVYEHYIITTAIVMVRTVCLIKVSDMSSVYCSESFLDHSRAQNIHAILGCVLLLPFGWGSNVNRRVTYPLISPLIPVLY